MSFSSLTDAGIGLISTRALEMSSPAGTAPGAEDSSPPSQRGPSPGSASGSTGRKTPQRRGSNKNRKPRQNSTSSNTSPASSEVKPSPANRSTHNRNPSRRGSHNGNNGPKNGPTVDNVSQSNPSDTVRQHSPIQQRRPAAPPAANINLTQQGAQPNHNMNPSASTLNPNAGGFQPGGLSALAEVQNEVLLTPTGDTFEMNSMASVLDQANAMGSNQPGVGGHNQQPPSIAQQIAQLQQLQLMQQSLGPNAPPQQLEQILNMQSNLMAQIRLAQAAQGTLPPRFAANQGAPQMSASGPHQQAPMTSTAMPNPALFASGGAGGQNPMQAHFQPQNQDMSALVNEQLAIQEQLEMLKAQQQDLLTRFADIQQTSPTEDMSSASAGMGGIPRAGHRRHQSQQPAGEFYICVSAEMKLNSALRHVYHGAVCNWYASPNWLWQHGSAAATPKGSRPAPFGQCRL